MLRPTLSEPEIEPVFQRLPPRTHDLEGFQVTRALPTVGRRSVGPWIFLDAFGPSDRLMDVGSHPHTGIRTLSWLTSGRIVHRDSLGSDQPVGPGEVSLMTSGRGLCHTETSVEGPISGVQLWLALPFDQRGCTPGYHHFPYIPRVEERGATITPFVGRYQGFQSPVLEGQDTIAMQVDITGPYLLTMEYTYEHALYVMEGSITFEGERLEKGDFVYLGMRGYGGHVDGNGRLLVLGGKPLEHPYLLWWNFLADDMEELRSFHRHWNADDGSFGDVDGAKKRLAAPDLPGGAR